MDELENFATIYELNNIETTLSILRVIFITLFSYYTNFKIINYTDRTKLKNIFYIIAIIIFAIICSLLKYETNSLISTICLILITSLIFSINTKNSIWNSILVTVLSISINYILFLISVMINFIINVTIKAQNDYINFAMIILVYWILLIFLFRIRKFKYGFLFLQNNSKDEKLDILILNIGAIIVFSIIILSNYQRRVSVNVFIGLIIFAIIMFITIQKSLQLYYKQKLLIQDLNETKEELEKKKQEIEQLEKENLTFSKKSHSLAHKQKALEYQINQLLLKSEIAEETSIETKLSNKTEKVNLEELIKVKDEISKLSKEVYNKTATVELSKTGIFEIDNILEYMQAESNKNDIEFNLQIKGNIYHMINNIIAKEDLQILLADHIKNAIIAIKHANNINKSILVKLGKIENVYSLYIYDSGIEFEKDTLLNLGKKPSTTHAKEGGTGMGFMNTFDTLKKYNASLIIDEIGKPSKDNYTKVLIIKFDNKCEFKLTSYRQEEIGEISEKLIDKSTTSDIIVENKS